MYMFYYVCTILCVTKHLIFVGSQPRPQEKLLSSAFFYIFKKLPCHDQLFYYLPNTTLQFHCYSFFINYV